jgi:hypothetical protein
MVPEPVQEVITEVTTVEPIPEVLPASFVTFTPKGEIHVHARNTAEAKMAIRELRTKKKELSLSKRAIMQEKREIRAAYTDLVRRRGSKFIGRGSIGRFIRSLQTLDRDAARRHLANELAPLEQEQTRIEAWIMAIDSVIIQLQGYI